MEPPQENRLKSLIFNPAVIFGFFLTVGLGVVVIALQQQQEVRSRAMVEPGGGGGGLRQCGSVSGEVCASDCPGGIETAAVCNSGYLKCCKPVSSGGSSSSGGSTATGVGTSCKSGTGKCIDVNKTSCSGTVYTGYCPGPSNVRCCVSGGSGGSTGGSGGSTTECGSHGCCSQKVSGGKCQYISQSCPGGFVASNLWYCPRGDDYRCCKPAPAYSAPYAAPPAAPPPASTKLSFDLLLHGIGKGGDNSTNVKGGNPSPGRPDRDLIVEVYNSSDTQKILTKEGVKMKYHPPSGSFIGTADLGTTLTTGSYIVKVKFKQSLLTKIGGGAHSITAGSTKALPQQELETGDVNNDRKRNVLDYNVLIGCFSAITAPVSCEGTGKEDSDIDDTNTVDQFDFNLLIREMGNAAVN